MSTNQSQFDLEFGGSILLSETALILRSEGVPDLTLDIPDLHARLRLIRWFGRLLDLMYARLNDLPVRTALVGKRDIPDLTVSLGTVWTRLHWPGGNVAITASDVEKALALLGVDAPVYRWRQYCRRMAEEDGMEMEAEFWE